MRKLAYLQGLRGMAALIVVMHHFACAFYPVTIFATGASHGIWEYYFWATPLATIIAGPAPVCLFFILSGYVLSLPFFGPKSKHTSQLYAAMVKRPFRLGGLVILTMIASFVLLRLGFYHDTRVAQVSGSQWLEEQWRGPVTLSHFLKNLIISPFTSGENYNQPLWTIYIELIGSYLTYLFVLLFKDTRIRWVAYGIIILQFEASYYLGFIIGTLLADITINYSDILNFARRVWLGAPLVIAGTYLAGYPKFIDPSRLSTTWYSHLPIFDFKDHYTMLGAFLIFCSLLVTPPFQRVLSLSIFCYLGRISFSLYAVHLLILRSLSLSIFLRIETYLRYDMAVAIAVTSSLLVMFFSAHILTVYFDEAVIRISDRIAAAWSASIGSNRKHDSADAIEPRPESPQFSRL